MANLISKENFEVIKVALVVEKTFYKTVSLCGYAIKDKRNNMLVNMADEFFSCFKSKSSAELCVKDGLFDGFTYYNIGE